MKLTGMRFSPEQPREPKKTTAKKTPPPQKKPPWAWLAGGAALLALLVFFLAGPLRGWWLAAVPTATVPVSYPEPSPSIQGPATKYALSAFVSNGYFYFRQGSSWHCRFIKGVNMGLSLPTTDLANPDIPYAAYYDWFTAMKAIGLNTVRVFTIMNPDFYRALYTYNTAHPQDPLFLFQGVWVNEEKAANSLTPYEGEPSLLQSFEKGVTEAADILHGNSYTTAYGLQNPALYDRDVSPWLAGYILGLEWNPSLISSTEQAEDLAHAYQGTYLTASGGAFVSFLAQVGDTLISYETSKYRYQAPVAFLNYSLLDVLSHTGDTENNDAILLDTRLIQATPFYAAGLFAALNVYPYYPEFMNFQTDYQQPVRDGQAGQTEEEGKADPFRHYLNALKAAYAMPVLVAEYGVPSSRGNAHQSSMGYNQGGLSETEQGEYNAKMLQDIAQSGCAGGLLFSWQDEWFKQTWNTYRYAPENPGGRPYNAQSAEQGYGLVAFQPAQAGLCYPDGDISEWQGTVPLRTGDYSLYAKADEGYLYLYIRTPGSANESQLAIGISTVGLGSLSMLDNDITFSRPADFVLLISGDISRLLTDAYYDAFYYRYAVTEGIMERNSAYEQPNSGLYNPINQLLRRPITANGEELPVLYQNAGLLTVGNGNPASPDYNSLTDICFSGNICEVRIPWALLNIADPAAKLARGDFYKGETLKTYSGIYMGLLDVKGSSSYMVLNPFTYTGWQTSTYITRYKASYQIFGKAIALIMPGY